MHGIIPSCQSEQCRPVDLQTITGQKILSVRKRFGTYLKIGNFARNSSPLAKAGVHLMPWETWIPACAGMTKK